MAYGNSQKERKTHQPITQLPRQVGLRGLSCQQLCPMASIATLNWSIFVLKNRAKMECLVTTEHYQWDIGTFYPSNPNKTKPISQKLLNNTTFSRQKNPPIVKKENNKKVPIGFRKIIEHKRLKNLSLYLKTPNERKGYPSRKPPENNNETQYHAINPDYSRFVAAYLFTTMGRHSFRLSK
ncbi:hypothetical protein ACJJIX_14975 [Microbulbifer sp. VAAC004]|uniref:hypothetical protein n=1 Tax=unclassified Microbulbifer TaxID=2619833 RepID=UPI0040396AA4